MTRLEATELNDLKNISTKILEFSNSKILVFEGCIGAGKTTLIKEICKALGISEKVTSPSYSIVNEYSSELNKVNHFDFYRINDEMEAYDIGIEDYFYSEDYCLIEWPEKIPSLIPENFTRIKIEKVDEKRYYVLENSN